MLSKANSLLKRGNYKEAWSLYEETKGKYPELAFTAEFNQSLIQRKWGWSPPGYISSVVARSPEGKLQSDEELQSFGAEEPVKAISGKKKPSIIKKNILFVAHAAHDRIYGGERSFIDIVSAVSPEKNNVYIVLPRLSEHYIEFLKPYCCQIFVGSYGWRDYTKIDDASRAFFKTLYRQVTFDLVYLNTIMLREATLEAKAQGLTTATHIRELINQDVALCQKIGGHSSAIIHQVIAETDYIIPNSKTTKSVFASDKTLGHLYNAINIEHFSKDSAGKLDTDVLNVGMISSNIPKKGVFDFYNLYLAIENETDLNIDFHLYGPENQHTKTIQSDLSKIAETRNKFHIAGYVSDPTQAFRKIDVLLNLSKFAESFGRTVGEGMAAGKAVVVYDYGAPPEFIDHGVNGYVVPYSNYHAIVEILKTLSEDKDKLIALGDNAQKKSLEFDFEKSYKKEINFLIDSIFHDKARYLAKNSSPLVSVIIPNYNYATYLPERILSIANQTYRNFEVIFLDDLSSDESVYVARRLLEQLNLEHKVIVNETNLGTYGQWLKGISLAKGELIWMAEADDICEPSLLEKLVAKMRDPACNIAYAQSYRLNGEGELTSPDNLKHTDALSKERWLSDYDNIGVREVVDYLCLRNTIPNASAALLRKSALSGIEEMLPNFRYSGDKLLYIYMLRSGSVSYVSEPLNGFRRHELSVTKTRNKSDEVLKENLNIRAYVADNFPISRSHIPLLDKFLDSDYKIEGVAKNSEHPSVVDAVDAVREKILPRRKIAFITCNNGSFDGGSEVWWREIIPHLKAKGHDVMFLIKHWHPKPDFIKSLEDMGVKPLYKHENGFDQLLEFEPDLTAISVGDQDEGLEYYAALKERGLKYIIVNRLTKEERFWPVNKKTLGQVKSGYLNAEKVFFTCKNNHQVMESRLKAELPQWGRIFSPCHASRDAAVPFPETESVHLAVPAKIQFVHKGQDLIVEVFSQEKWRERNLVVNFYGVGKDEDRLRSMIKEAGLEDKLIMRGRIVQVGSEQSISDIWKNNHAVLMASRMEGFPNMVLNAMLSGRMPIVPNIGGCAEIIEDNVNGFIAPNPSVEDLDAALERAYSRLNEWRDLGLKARKAALDYLPEDVHANTLEKIYGVLQC